MYNNTRSFQQLTTDNLSKKLFGSVSKKGNTADEELVEDDPHRPPVHWLPVALPKDHFWGDVFRSTTDLHKYQHGSEEEKPPATGSSVLRSGHLTCLSTNSRVSFSM